MSLERFASFGVKMKDCGGDLGGVCKCGQERSRRASMGSGHERLEVRMQDTATAGRWRSPLLPLYQAALATYGGPVATALMKTTLKCRR